MLRAVVFTDEICVICWFTEPPSSVLSLCILFTTNSNASFGCLAAFTTFTATIYYLCFQVRHHPLIEPNNASFRCIAAFTSLTSTTYYLCFQFIHHPHVLKCMSNLEPEVSGRQHATYPVCCQEGSVRRNMGLNALPPTLHTSPAILLSASTSHFETRMAATSWVDVKHWNINKAMTHIRSDDTRRDVPHRQFGFQYPRFLASAHVW